MSRSGTKRILVWFAAHNSHGDAASEFYVSGGGEFCVVNGGGFGGY